MKRIIKKIVSTITAVAIMTSCFPAVFADSAGGFQDIAGHWAENSINRWNEYSIVSGVGNGNFDPDGKLTRAQMATILANILNLKESSENPFQDVSPTDWFSEAVLKCYKAGIMQGDGINADPNGELTREQAMVLLCRSLGIPVASEDELSNYKDSANISSWAKGYVAAMVKAGIVSGTGENTISPLADMSRAALMTVLDRAVGEYINSPGTYDLTGKEGIVIVASDNAVITGSTNATLVITEGVKGGKLSFQGAVISGKITNLAEDISVSVDSDCEISDMPENATVENDEEKPTETEVPQQMPEKVTEGVAGGASGSGSTGGGAGGSSGEGASSGNSASAGDSSSGASGGVSGGTSSGEDGNSTEVSGGDSTSGEDGNSTRGLNGGSSSGNGGESSSENEGNSSGGAGLSNESENNNDNQGSTSNGNSSVEIEYGWYGAQLADGSTEKKVYDHLFTKDYSIRVRDEYDEVFFDISKSELNPVFEGWAAFRNDHPERDIFLPLVSCRSSDSETSVYLPIYKNHQNIETILEEKAAEFADSFDKEQPIIKQYISIHDYICKIAEYDNDLSSDYMHSAAGLFLGEREIVCDGYSKAFKLFCDAVNLPCEIIDGYAGTYNSGHSWNEIQLDGKWYGADICWDDSDINAGSYVNNEYINNTVMVSTCGYTYFADNKYYTDGEDNMHFPREFNSLCEPSLQSGIAYDLGNTKRYLIHTYKNTASISAYKLANYMFGEEYTAEVAWSDGSTSYLNVFFDDNVGCLTIRMMGDFTVDTSQYAFIDAIRIGDGKELRFESADGQPHTLYLNGTTFDTSYGGQLIVDPVINIVE